MNRVSKSSRRQEPQESSSEDDSFSDSEVEQFVQAPHRDDTLRPRTSNPRSSKTRGAAKQPKDAALEATHEEVEPVEAPAPKAGVSGATLMLAMTRHAKPSPRQFKADNHYIPDAGNMFEVVYQMTHLLQDNTKLYELVPDYTTIALNLYYGHVYFYQVLRARDAIGSLTRLERRSLRIYESIGKPEAWPIACPLTGFVQALGACEIDDKMFSIITPAFPVWTFTARQGLTGLGSTPGAGRVPIIPAYQQFLHLYGAKQAHYDDATQSYRPIDAALSATNMFAGLKASTATSTDFQTLAFNSAWNMAMETEEPIGPMSRGGIMTRVHRWSIPAVENTLDIGASLENFLFPDQDNMRWMHQLLKLSAGVNKFFPGSTNLGAIPPTTVRENFVKVEYNRTTARTAETEKWYHTRSNWSITATADTYGDSVNPLVQMGIASSTHAVFTDGIRPALIANAFSPVATGPYFVTTGTDITVPIVQSDIFKIHDPVDGLTELLFSLYDNDPK